jgi:hypothetical protein
LHKPLADLYKPLQTFAKQTKTYQLPLETWDGYRRPITNTIINPSLKQTLEWSQQTKSCTEKHTKQVLHDID